MNRLTTEAGHAPQLSTFDHISFTFMIPPILVAMFPPSADALLAKCGELVTDDMLHEISEADHGYSVVENFAVLLSIRDELRVPAPMDFIPREVLQLVRWSQPEEYARDLATVERDHIKRAFCCAALLRSIAAYKGTFNEDENQSLIQLIDSVFFLSIGLPTATGSFLTWRLPQMSSDDEDRPFCAFGLMALALLNGNTALSASDINGLVSIVEDAESDVLDSLRYCPTKHVTWSFLAATYYDQRHAAWRALAARLHASFPDHERLVALAQRVEMTSACRPE